ncbi:MAG: pyridoxal phosphate-dependent aminotransferase [Bacteroidales bacterium]|nr:pyridoxal phosphate-dependent aminotransferase [Bacteroidales bacterium]
MKRRTFLKSAAAAGAAAMLPSSVLSLASGCTSENMPGWNFDEVLDRTGTWSIKYRRAEGGKLAMWIADMDFKTDPVVSQALRERLEKDVFGYTYGPDAFFEAIAGWEKAQHGFDVPIEWVEYAPGVIASLCQIYLAFTEPGDKVVVQTPVYDPFFNYARRLGRIAVENPLLWKDGHYEMDFEGLERLYDKRVKVLVLCNPHNPVGIIWPEETLSRLAQWCAEHDVLVVSDEIHADLSLYGRHHTPFCRVNETAAQIGIQLCSPTKAFNFPGITGSAYAIIPDPVKRQRFHETLENAKLREASIPTLVATIAAYTHEPVWLEAVKRYIEGNIDCVEDFFSRHACGIRPVRPEASFLIWLDCRALGLPQAELMDLFNEKAGVVMNNGAGYGTGGEGFVRLNVGCPRSVVEEALRRIESALQQ